MTDTIEKHIQFVNWKAIVAISSVCRVQCASPAQRVLTCIAVPTKSPAAILRPDSYVRYGFPKPLPYNFQSSVFSAVSKKRLQHPLCSVKGPSQIIAIVALTMFFVFAMYPGHDLL